MYGEPFQSDPNNLISGGAVKLVLYPFYIGVPMVVMKRFEPVQFCKNVERYQVTFSFVAPPVLVVLTRHPGKLP